MKNFGKQHSAVVSIITPSYNSSKFISETINSVVSQTFTCWEMIIVDDCSIDGSFDKISELIESEPRIKLISLDINSGAATARNKAIELAVGRYIAFLDSDDLWYPNKLEYQLSFMKENNIAFCYSAYEKVDENGNFIGSMGVPEKSSYRDMLKTCYVGCLTAIYDTEKIGKFYMPSSTKREDFATWINILKKIDYAYGLNEVLAKYRVYSAQISASKVKMAKETWRFYREVERLGLFSSLYYFSHYALRGVLRAKFPSAARFLGVLQ
ncbi:glycosyltransferase family 2 protein [Rheinheimera sp. EpRS3]|uniref:glycosyltransferase family 2 protein n=1 Tax=Rheinheimera sp. EpRS3 TaxID=1712383 RepID=UPI0007477862|nr:glycosyltransferase family 2 protein [Rheinheimera sp. EpRS3]KUM52488.1 glycosyl transferase [Rheinheimera sp. EpRS3]